MMLSCPSQVENENDKTSLLSLPAPSGSSADADTDALIAQEMNGLSVKERDHVIFDLHGVNELPNETPEFIYNNLKAMDRALSNLFRGKHAYEMALSKDPEYVRDFNFRLMFLRATNWKARAAAVRILRFFNTKLELFGEDRLVKNITQTDLPPNAIKCLYSGYVQVLPFRDRSGRALILGNNSLVPDNLPIDDRLRCLWYITMAAAQDLETNKNGVVVISYMLGANGRQLDRKSAWKISMMSMVSCVLFILIVSLQ